MAKTRAKKSGKDAKAPPGDVQTRPGPGATPPEIMELWHRYKEHGDIEDRDALIEYYMPLAYREADRLATKYPSSVEVDDLRIQGSMGLIDAIEKFDPTKNIKFETYCTMRLRGEILDFLRKIDWVPRHTRTRSHQLERQREELERRLGRPADHDEMAEYIGKTPEEYEELLRELDVKSMVSLDSRREDDADNELGSIDVLPDTASEDPIEELERREIRELALRGLNEKEQAILVMYYYDGLSQKEIGAALDISESRVCQIHQQTLARVHEKFKARGISTL